MRRDKLALILVAVVAAVSLGVGCWQSYHGLAAAGAAGLVLVCARVALGRRSRTPEPSVHAPSPPVPLPADPPRRKPADPQDPNGFVDELLAQGRYALLLRPQIAGRLDDLQFQQALRALAEGMALVPDGEVLLEPLQRGLWDGPGEEGATAEPGRVVHVEPFFLDRHPVTNQQYYEFIEAGGYQEAELWNPLILPALLTFVDETGLPGPRFWREGRYAPGRAYHPVVGICSYEADAYARWAGKRLPSDAEWVKAGCWPINMSGMGLSQRRFPWGDTMDRNRANLWGSGPGDTVPVDQYAEGVSVGGICHLIGNVWEWTSEDFPPKHSADTDWLLEVPMKSIRGGAFDTYFDNQATCQFQSADTAIARKHNIGLRCAVCVRDVLLARGACGSAPAVDEQDLEPVELEV